MFLTILDIFSDDILDYVNTSELDVISSIRPAVVKMYKSSFLEQCMTCPRHMHAECSYCSLIAKCKRRQGSYICTECLTKRITIFIF